MDLESYLEINKKLQKSIIDFVESEINSEENYQNIIDIIADQKIKNTPTKLEETLDLISNISNYHNRPPKFLNKIEKILKYLKDDIKQTFSNSKIFKIFKNNKRILLFLIEEKIITVDQSIADLINSEKYKKFQYHQFFYLEIKPFISNEHDTKIEVNEEFIAKRIIGENDDYVCQLIRTDSIDKFISFVNQKNLNLSTKIESSIFETNPFLLKNDPTLIEYSAFFGSIQIFKYLFLNNAKYSPTSLWQYSVHGNNPELFAFLEEYKTNQINNSCEIPLLESIKCHHIDVANNIINNYNYIFGAKMMESCLKYKNFQFLPNDLSCKMTLFYLCKYNCIYILKFFLDSRKVHINTKVIPLIIFFIKFQDLLF